MAGNSKVVYLTCLDCFPFLMTAASAVLRTLGAAMAPTKLTLRPDVGALSKKQNKGQLYATAGSGTAL
jgi:hypothetical protein